MPRVHTLRDANEKKKRKEKNSTRPKWGKTKENAKKSEYVTATNQTR